MKYTLLLLSMIVLVALSACQSDKKPKHHKGTPTPLNIVPTVPEAEQKSQVVLGELSEEQQKALAKPKSKMPGKDMVINKVNYDQKLNKSLFEKGQKVYNNQCASCHSLDGSAGQATTFKNLLGRRDGAWVINFIRDVDTDFGATAAEQQKFEQCPTRTDAKTLHFNLARDFVEFARTL